MEFRLDDEQQMIVQTIRRFTDRDLRGWAADARRAGGPPARLRAVDADVQRVTRRRAVRAMG